MASRTWRDSAAPLIAKVIDDVGTDDMRALRSALREAYPYGERRYWPYKVWLDEIRRQLSPPSKSINGRKSVASLPGQMSFFDD